MSPGAGAGIGGPAARTATPALAMRGISKRFGELQALDEVELEVEPGEIHALLGENGAGKSTLMNVLYGLARPDAGRVELDGRAVDITGPRAARAAGIGMVHQHLMLVEPFTVAENLVLDRGPASAGLYRPAQEEGWARELSARLGLPLDAARRVSGLSMGERQRVEIVKALQSGARVLVLDEPTTVLTPSEVGELFRAVRQLAAQGRAIVFISHKLTEVMELCDRVSVLRAGRLQGTVAASKTDPEDLARRMVGRTVAAVTRPPRPSASGPVLEVEGLEAAGAFRAVGPVSFRVEAGEIVGVAGVDGNGQLELCEALAGVRPILAGRVRVRGVELGELPPLDRARAGLGVVPEDRTASGVIGEMSVAENLSLRAHRRPELAWGPFSTREKLEAMAVELMERFDVRPRQPGLAARALSGGNQQKMLLARELAERPAALVASNPTRGLDVAATEALQNRLLQARAAGMAILLVSADLDEILALSDRVLVAFRGRLAELPAGRTDREAVGLAMGGEGFGPAS